jgi:predicted dinucleotide-binding enzyme
MVAQSTNTDDADRPDEPAIARTEDQPAMQVAIIGAGNVGTALATAFVRAGHDVVIASRDAEDAANAAAASGARIAPSNVAAVEGADVVIPAVYFPSLTEVAAEIATAAAGIPVVDVSNRLSFGAAGPEIDTTSSNAEDLAAMLPGSPVIKAFNTLFAARQVDPIVSGVRLDGFVAGDDATAKALVLELVASIGLHPVDVGPLARARQLEGLAFLNMALNITNEGAWQSGWSLVAAPAAKVAA